MASQTMTTGWATIMVLTLVGLMAGALQAPVAAQTEDKLASLIKDTGLKYKALDEYSYHVPFELDDDRTLDVFVTYNNEEKKFVLIFTTLLDYEDGHEFKPEVMARALAINNDYPVIKLCLDAEHGDLDCQSEVYVRTLDAQSLDMHINLVAAIAAQLADELKAMEEGEAVG